MKYNHTLLLLLLLGITSCVSCYKMKVITIEIRRPPVQPNIEKIDTIALFSRDMIRLDTTTYQYFSRNQPMMDSTIRYTDNYNTCINALAEMLVNEGSFLKVINCRDSMNELIRTTDSTLFPELFYKLGADALIFLDRYKLNDFQYRKGDFGTSEITGDFREFMKSAYLANIWGSLQWTIRIKGDTTRYETLQMDDLYYGDSVYPEFFGSRERHKRMLDNTSVYFGKQFSENLISSWQQAERSYYTSHDSLMQNGSKYCIKGEWLKAADAYKRLVDNKNRKVSSRAAYNMALVCEMAGEINASIDWLKRSESACRPNDAPHKERCIEYLQILKERQNEIESLDKLNSKNAVNKR